MMQMNYKSRLAESTHKNNNTHQSERDIDSKQNIALLLIARKAKTRSLDLVLITAAMSVSRSDNVGVLRRANIDANIGISLTSIMDRVPVVIIGAAQSIRLDNIVGRVEREISRATDHRRRQLLLVSVQHPSIVLQHHAIADLVSVESDIAQLKTAVPGSVLRFTANLAGLTMLANKPRNYGASRQPTSFAV